MARWLDLQDGPTIVADTLRRPDHDRPGPGTPETSRGRVYIAAFAWTRAIIAGRAVVAGTAEAAAGSLGHRTPGLAALLKTTSSTISQTT